MPSYTSVENALQAGMAALRTMSGVPVTYTSGATVLSISNAVQGDTRKGTIEVGGDEQVVEIADWLIAVKDFESLGSTPNEGDTIARVISGTTYTWTVEHRDMGETHWDWSDTSRTQYRIRTRKDGAGAYEISQPTGFDLGGNELRA